MGITSAEQRFYDTYVVELKAEIANRPDEYSFPILKADDVAMKMTIALKNGTGNKDSRAIRRTCKKMNIPYTNMGIRNYLNSGV